DLPVELHICATGTGTASEKYRRDVQRAAACDQRIRFFPATAHELVDAFLVGIEALAVPSQWMETGPLVVLEAFAAGTPVIGSNLGGIAELVHHEQNGLLVEAGSRDQWIATVNRVLSDDALIERLRAGVIPPRSIADVGL